MQAYKSHRSQLSGAPSDYSEYANSIKNTDKGQKQCTVSRRTLVSNAILVSGYQARSLVECIHVLCLVSTEDLE